MTEEEKKKCEKIINSYIGYNEELYNPYLPKDKYKHIEVSITLAKEVFNKDITEEEAEKILGYDRMNCVILVSYISIKNVFWNTAYILDIYFNKVKNNSIKD